MPFKRREGESEEEYEARKEARKQERAPREPRGDTAPRSTGPRSMAGEIHVAVASPNDVLRMLPWTAEDALEPHEVKALVSALDKQQQISPRFRRGLKRFTKASAGANLYVCLAMIALPRLERHGLIPGSVIQAMQGRVMQEQAQDEQAPAAQYGPPAVHGVNSHIAEPVEA